MSKITYTDKEYIYENAEIPEINKITDGNMNEIKKVVNENDTRLTTAEGEIDNLQNAILDEICPVGKTEIFYDNEDHSDYLGFTWERTSIGKVPVGIDSSDTDFNTIGKTGGEKTHKLTINEMPEHKHELGYFDDLLIAGGSNYGSPGSGATYGQGWNTKVAGGNTAHNNLQPYVVMAFWKRVA